MKTAMILLTQYEAPTIPLEKICMEYFSCNRSTAFQKAKAGTLPVPAFRTGQSQKSPWMVHINDLAAYIDKQRELAVKHHVGVA